MVAPEEKCSSLSPGVPLSLNLLGDGSSQRRHGFKRGGVRKHLRRRHNPLQIQTDSTDRKRLGMSVFGTTFVESIRGPGYRGRRRFHFNPTRYVR